MENALLILTVSPNPKEKYPKGLKLKKRTWIIEEFSEYPHLAEHSTDMEKKILEKCFLISASK